MTTNLNHSQLPAPGASRRGTLVLLAVAAGLSAANLYYAQPLAALMAKTLHAAPRDLGLALTMTQVGYALGMLLIVPIGDSRERRSLLVLTAAAAVPALLLVAGAWSVGFLALSSFLLGAASSLPQLAVPFAVGLVAPEERGQALGNVMGGLLAGILLSRTISGILGTHFGWRVTFVVAALAMAVLAVVLRFALPVQRPTAPLPWTKTIASLLALVRREPQLRRHALVGALGFASFSVFWSTLAFHLAELGSGAQTAGLFGAIGVVGVVAAPMVGALARRVPARTINAGGLLLVASSFVLCWLGASSLVLMGAAVALLDAGVQGSHLANQTIIFGLNPQARNRLNAVYMVAYFGGGALGTLLAAWAWGAAGWAGVCFAGAGLALLGLAPLRTSPGLPAQSEMSGVAMH